MPDDHATLKTRAFNVIYILAKGFTYLLMLLAAFGVFLGIIVIKSLFTAR